MSYHNSQPKQVNYNNNKNNIKIGDWARNYDMTPQESINPIINPKNIYQEQNTNQMNQKGQTMNNIKNLEDQNKNNYPSQNPQNNQNQKKYKITPGQSIREEMNNPYKGEEKVIYPKISYFLSLISTTFSIFMDSNTVRIISLPSVRASLIFSESF